MMSCLTVSQPPYSLDLNPTNFFHFSQSKIKEEMEKFIEVLLAVSKDAYQAVFDCWKNKYQHGLINEVDYILKVTRIECYMNLFSLK